MPESPRRLVVNADDFGRSRSINEAVIRAHRAGILTTTSLMVSEPGFDEAALAALEPRWPVNRWPVQDLYFGGVHVAAPGGAGAGDPRRGGSAATVDLPTV